MPSAEACDAAYQGEAGAYSEQAAWALVGDAARLLPCRSLAAMFDVVVRGDARHAVLPIENTLAGTVPGAYELLLQHPLTASGETRVQIDHVLAAAPGARLSHVRRVLSHPVALEQCRRFFAAHPELEPVPVFDTAGAVGMALEDRACGTAAIASRRAAALHHAVVLAERIQDHEENWTRFLLLGGASTIARHAAHAIIAFRLPHEPGALARVLQHVADHHGNITKIESRPIEGRPFEYAFLLELQLDVAAAGIGGVVEVLRGASCELRLLGAY